MCAPHCLKFQNVINMKKISLLGMLIASLGMQAQVIGDKIENTCGIYVGESYLSGNFTIDNKSYFLSGEDFSGDETLKIFDDGLQLVKEITFPEINIRDGYEKRSRAEEYSVEIMDKREYDQNLERYQEEFAGEIPTEEEIIAILTKWGLSVDTIFVEEGCKCFASKDDYDYYKFSKYDYKYPTTYYKLSGKNLYCINVSYSEERKYTGEWETTENYYSLEPICRVDYLDLNNVGLYEDSKIYISQILFNKDEVYEYVRPIYEEKVTSEEYDRDGDGEVDQIYTYFDPLYAGFEIVNESGEVLQSIRFDSSKFYVLHQLIKINDKHYWVAYDDSDTDEREHEWYVFTPGFETGLKKVQLPAGLSVMPSLAKRHQSITIETDDVSKNREVNIVDASGKSVWRQILPAGQKSIRVNATKLSKGLNVVNVDGEKEKSVKVIVN